MKRAGQHQAGVAPATIRLAVKGLSARERQLLEGLVRISTRDTRRGAQPIALVTDAETHAADVVLLDATQPEVLAWAGSQPWLGTRAVIWLDASDTAANHTIARRPLHWPAFPMLLLYALENARYAPPAAQPAGAPKAVPRFMLVDDSHIARAQIRSHLVLRGCDTTEASSVDECLAHLGKQRFDMVFMDVVMPGVDGYDGCRMVKSATRAGGDLPVVMLTSRSSPFDRIRGKFAGCDAYLTKPVNAQRLDDVLAQFIAGAHVLSPLAVRQARHVTLTPTSGRIAPGAA